MSNLKLGLRTLFKTPFVTVVAALSLALGIGTNAAIFSIFDEVLRRPLPVHEPDGLVNLIAPGPKAGSTSSNSAGDSEHVFSYPMFKDLQRVQTSFEGIAGHVIFGANVGFDKQTLSLDGMFVSGSYFPLLGLQPEVGRLIGPADDEVEGAHPVIVLGYDFWLQQMGGDRSVVDRTIVVNGQPMTILGVAPRTFRGTTVGEKPSVYIPMAMRELLLSGSQGMDSRRNYWVYLFARLNPGVSLEQAQSAINGPYQQILREVEAPLQTGMSEQTLERFRNRQIELADGRHGQSEMLEEAGAPISMLFVLTGIVLLIACANIANLLLARGASRAMEISIRMSLGATRRHVLFQLLTESVILAVLGGIASLLFARWTLDFITTLLPPEATETMLLSLSWPTVAFSFALAIGTGLIFGLYPALHNTRSELVTNLRNNAGSVASGKQASRFRNSLVIAQIALSMALLVSAGLFIKSLRNVNLVDLGVDVDNVVTFRIIPQRNGYEGDRALALYQRVEEELRGLPGVLAVSSATVPLIAGSNWSTSVSVQGFQRGPDTDVDSNYSLVGMDYLRTVGIPLLQGRDFTEADAAGAPRVAIVNEAFVKKFGLGRDAVGKLMAPRQTDSLDVEIVGVVRDAKYSDVKEPVPPVFYRPYRQGDAPVGLSFFARTSGDPARMLSSISPVIARLDPNLPIEDLKTMPQQIRETIVIDRMISILAGAFAAIATVLASIGLYGVLAYSTAQRTREIGVRIALGARGSRVRGLVLRQVGRMTLIGGVLGMIAGVLVGRAARTLLYGLEGQDPWVMIVAAVVLTGVALAAAYLPARRASQVDPMQALRYQ
jgi:predicted permease